MDDYEFMYFAKMDIGADQIQFVLLETGSLIQ